MNVQDQKLEGRISELENAITNAGVILAQGEIDGKPLQAIKDAMAALDVVMKDPQILKKQGI
jgi:hypothetical protein